MNTKTETMSEAQIDAVWKQSGIEAEYRKFAEKVNRRVEQEKEGFTHKNIEELNPVRDAEIKYYLLREGKNQQFIKATLNKHRAEIKKDKHTETEWLKKAELAPQYASEIAAKIDPEILETVTSAKNIEDRKSPDQKIRESRAERESEELSATHWRDLVTAGIGAGLMVGAAMIPPDAPQQPQPSAKGKEGQPQETPRVTFGKILKTTFVVTAPFVGLYLLSRAFNNWQGRAAQNNGQSGGKYL